MTLTQINKAGLDEIALDHVFTIGASGSSAYTFQGEGLNGTVNNPTLYLTRGKTYRFENGSGGHPIRIQSTSGASGTAYNTGVTNNAGSGTVIVEVQHDAPDVLYYQCTSHAAMNGVLYITGALADGGVTTAKIADSGVTTAKIAADAVTGAKIADDAINSEHYTDGSIDTAHIADSQVTNAKLADNAVSTARIADGAVNANKLGSAVVTTAKIEDNAVTSAKIADSAVTDAKIASGISASKITGLATDSITEGDSKVEVIDSGSNGNIQFITDNTTRAQLKTGSNCDNQLLIGTAGTSNRDIDVGVCIGSSSFSRPGVIIRGNTTNKGDISFCDNSQQDSADGVSEGLIRYDHATDHMEFHTADSERLRIDSSGRVGIGTGSSITNYDPSARTLILNESGTLAGMTIRSSSQGSIYFADGTTGNQSYRGRIEYDHANDKMYMGAGASTAGIHIDSDCIVTKPNQPFALLHSNSGDTGASNNKINNDYARFTGVQLNVGNNYSTSTGKFTCPVDGVYGVAFTSNLNMSNLSVGNSFNIQTRQNQSIHMYNYNTVFTTGWQQMTFTNYINCSANDELQFYFSGSNSFGADQGSGQWGQMYFWLQQ